MAHLAIDIGVASGLRNRVLDSQRSFVILGPRMIPMTMLTDGGIQGKGPKDLLSAAQSSQGAFKSVVFSREIHPAV